MLTINKRIIYSIELSILALISLLSITYHNIKRADSTDGWIMHTSEVLIHCTKMQLRAAEGEVLIRDYVLTGNPLLMKKFGQNISARLKEYKLLRQLTSDNKAIQPVMDSLRFYVYQNDISDKRNIISKIAYYSKIIEGSEHNLMFIRKSASQKASLIMNGSLIVSMLFISTLILLMWLKTKNETVKRIGLIAELYKNEQRNNKAEKLALFGTWSMNIPQAKLNSSNEMSNLWGFEPDSEKNGLRRYLNKVHPNDKKPLIRMLRHSIKRSGIVGFHFRLFNNEQVKYLSAGMTVDRDANGTLVEVTGYVQDITEKTENTTKLKTANKELKLLFNRIGEVLFSRDILRNEFIMISDNCKALTGYSIQEFFDQQELWITIIHENDRYLVELGNAQLAMGKSIVNQFRIIKKDGQIRWVENKMVPLINDDGELIRIDSVIKNITNKKSAEFERDKIIADIVQRNRTLEQFTYIVSHNLRAPVANIYGLCQLLGLSFPNKSEENTEILDRMSSSVTSLDDILKDLNRILQAREHNNETKETIDLGLLLNEVKNSLGEALTGNNITITSDFSAIKHIFSIHSYVFSIFFNLLLNSINFRRKALPTLISIKTVFTEDYIELLFTDNGKGIDLIKHGSTIFGLYRRYDRAIEGKGMGLFTTKTQIEALGGTIEVKSALNEGATFSIKFKAGTLYL